MKQLPIDSTLASTFYVVPTMLDEIRDSRARTYMKQLRLRLDIKEKVPSKTFIREGKKGVRRWLSIVSHFFFSLI